MKKLLALMMALVLALSCVGAFAEDTTAVLPTNTTTTISISMNGEMFAALAGDSATEEDQQMLAQTLSLINNLGARIITTENGVQAELTLKDTTVATVVGVTSETGALAVSDLFPSYAVTLAPETLAQTLPGPSLDTEALMAALQAKLDALTESVASYAGEAQMGEYTFEGATFNVMQPYQMTMKEFATLLLSWMQSMMADPELAPLFSSMEGLDADALSEAMEELNEMGEEQATAPVNAALYAVMDANGQPGEDAYITFDMTEDENIIALAFGKVQNVAYAHLIYGDAAYTSLDEMRQAAIAGAENAIVVDLAAAPGEGEADIAMGLDLYNQGVYMGLLLQSARTEAGLAQNISLYMMNDQAPLFTLDALTVPGGEITASPDTEGKTLVSLEALMADEEGTLSGNLLMDIMSYGLNTLIANASIVMPDEVTALVNAMSAPAPEATDAPAEGVSD